MCENGTCAAPFLVTSTPFVLTGPDLSAFDDEGNFGSGSGCVLASGIATGPDVVFQVDLLAGEKVTVRELGIAEVVMDVLEPGTCSAGASCVESADSPESIGGSYTATSSGPVNVVVELENPGDYSIEIDVTACGNGVVEPTEACDDGNTTPNDGCSPVCDYEVAAAALAADCSGTVYTYGPTATLPVDVPDGSSIPLDLSFVVPQLGTVEKAAVRVSITHPSVTDLDISLVGPNAPIVNLSSDNGGSGDDYTNTIFIEGGLLPITSGTPPFTGTFDPEGDMGNFVGITPTGVWILRIDDDSDTATGTVTFAGLALCIVP